MERINLFDALAAQNAAYADERQIAWAVTILGSVVLLLGIVSVFL